MSHFNNGKLAWFLLTTVTLVLISVVGAWALDVRQTNIDQDRRITTIERSLSRVEVMIETLLHDRGLPVPK